MSPVLERAVRAVPGGQRGAYRLASAYVAGPRAEDALACAHRLAAEGLASSIDYFGENVSDPIEAERVTERYVELAGMLGEAPPDAFLSIDLSHIGLAQPGDHVRARLERIASVLPPGRLIEVGAEQARDAGRIQATVAAVAGAGGAVAATIQANLRRSRADALALAEQAVPLRLVKGAYEEDPVTAFPRGEATDLAFLELAHELRAGGAEVAIATHDAVLRESLLRALPGIGIEMLLGVRSADATALAARGVQVRIYVPYGEDWLRYALRRWAESLRRKP
jgi:proline dehydrogenase